MGAHQLPLQSARALSGGFYSVYDPGASGTMNPTKVSGFNICEVVTAAAESRALPAASGFPVGTCFIVTLKTDGGDLSITGATTGTATLDDAGEVAYFILTDANGTKQWMQLISISSLTSLSLADDTSAVFGTGGDMEILFSTADASNHTSVIALDNTSQQLHITDLGAKATDWNLSATTDPNIYIHSNTTPATDYLRIGDHTGTVADIDVVGGTTLNLQIAGTSIAQVTAAGILLAVDDDNFTVGAGSDASLRWSTADADNHALVLSVGQSNQVLHIAENDDIGVDWNIAANAADAEILIHSSTTPATDFLRIGGHDGTTAGIDVVGGTTLDFRFGGTDAVVLTATAMTFAATCFPVLPITDTDGTVEGSIWYDASENKLKFWNGSAAETITSA